METPWIIDNFFTTEKSNTLINTESGHFFMFKAFPNSEEDFKVFVELIDGKMPVTAKITISIAGLVNPESIIKEETFKFDDGKNNFEINFARKQSNLVEEGYFEDGSMILSVSIDILNAQPETIVIGDDENETLVHHQVECNDYCGLVNLGATCYINSALQVLYNIPLLRQKIFQTDIEDPVFDPNVQNPQKTFEKKKKRKIFINALQTLFAKMQLQKGKIDTYNFTRTLGFNDDELCQQKDITEFLDFVLTEIGDLSDIFKGKLRSFIRCKNVKYESSRDQDFITLQLDVKGHSSLEESFDAFFQKQELTGDNKYKTNEFGYQDAELGNELTSLPSVLIAHLKRFEFDYETGENIKINQYFSFPKSISLSKYVVRNTNDTRSKDYELIGVVVHTGTSLFGHYYAFIRPQADEKWVKFNDSSVTFDDDLYAIDDNFGGFRNDSDSLKSYSAYILVYARKDEINSIFTHVDDSIITEKIKQAMSSVTKDISPIFVNFNDHRFVKARKTSGSKRIFTIDSLKRDLRRGRLWFTSEYQNLLNFDPSMSYKELYNAISESIGETIDMAQVWAVNSFMPSFFIELDQNGNCKDFANCTGFFVDLEYNFEDVDKLAEEDFLMVFIYIYVPSLKDPLRLYDHVIRSASLTSSSIINDVEEKTGVKFFPEVLTESQELIEFDSSIPLGVFAIDMSVTFVLSTSDRNIYSKIDDMSISRIPVNKKEKSITNSEHYSFPDRASKFFNDEKCLFSVDVEFDSKSERISFPPDLMGGELFDFIVELFNPSFDDNEDVMAIYTDNNRTPIILDINKTVVEQGLIGALKYTVFIENSKIANARLFQQRIIFYIINHGTISERNDIDVGIDVKMDELCSRIEGETDSMLFPIVMSKKKVKRIIQGDELVSSLSDPIYFTKKIDHDVEGVQCFFTFARINVEEQLRTIDFPFIMNVGEKETADNLAQRICDIIHVDVVLYIKRKVYEHQKLAGDSIVIDELAKEEEKNVYIIRK